VISLVFAVSEGNQCSLDHCTNCRALILVDHLSLARRVCVHCQNDERRRPVSEALAIAEPAPGFSQESRGEPVQLDLFDRHDCAQAESTRRTA
jgi:hypothetical protein